LKKEEAKMVTSTLVRFVAAVVAATAVAGSMYPAQATSDALISLAAPRWAEQTVYRPGCPNIERDCGCRFDSSGEPNCAGW
jgi:hypothetical protein